MERELVQFHVRLVWSLVVVRQQIGLEVLEKDQAKHGYDSKLWHKQAVSQRDAHLNHDGRVAIEHVVAWPVVNLEVLCNRLRFRLVLAVLVETALVPPLRQLVEQITEHEVLYDREDRHEYQVISELRSQPLIPLLTKVAVGSVVANWEPLRQLQVSIRNQQTKAGVEVLSDKDANRRADESL